MCSHDVNAQFEECKRELQEAAEAANKARDEYFDIHDKLKNPFSVPGAQTPEAVHKLREQEKDALKNYLNARDAWTSKWDECAKIQSQLGQ